MRNTTLHLPDLYLKMIDEIICEKEYPCLSEFIRIAIRKMLKRDMVLLKNPKVGKISGEIQNYIAKQTKVGLQKKLDQFKIILDQNPALQKKLELKGNSFQIKQTRIDRYWK